MTTFGYGAILFGIVTVFGGGVMRVLYVGGTGEISLSCVKESVAAGHDVTVFNRGSRGDVLPVDVTALQGDLRDDATYAALAEKRFDAVCQFLAYTEDDVARDVRTFAGKTGHYVFIASASSYQRPARTHRITEDVPLENPFSAYSRNKAAAETIVLSQSDLPATVVRPSHTIHTRFPTVLREHLLLPWRIENGKPIVTHGDGTSLWTVTRSEDFAIPFVRLLGNPDALGEAVHITSDRAYTWDQLYHGIGACLGKPVDIVHVPTDTIVRYFPELAETLYGDKTASLTFDNSKIKQLAGAFSCAVELTELLAGPAEFYKASGYRPDEDDLKLDARIDAMIEAQRAVGPA
ncbi:NAD-dependent epimerase/dehydratase family protein [Hoeflea sp.]|uniref:NAD-dependent epimerase/dehydratase family protein n=1 Tax=Hoeflea sp. TaxID=1940281 RepID=UPI003B014BDD